MISQKPGRVPRLDFTDPLAQYVLFCTPCNTGYGNAVTDLSPYRNHGVFVNTPTWVKGKDGGYALRFAAASSQGVNFTPSVTDNLFKVSEVTIECRFYPTNVNSNYRDILRHGDLNVQPYVDYALVQFNDNKLYFSVGITNIIHCATTGTLSNNTWYHAFGTWDGTTSRIYLNSSTQNNSASASGSLTGTNNRMPMGYSIQWGEYFDGIIDFGIIYRKALNASEIQRRLDYPY